MSKGERAHAGEDEGGAEGREEGEREAAAFKKGWLETYVSCLVDEVIAIP